MEKFEGHTIARIIIAMARLNKIPAKDLVEAMKEGKEFREYLKEMLVQLAKGI